MAEVKPDLCSKCDEPLNWYTNPYMDAGKCPECGEIYYPVDIDDIEDINARD